MPDQLLEANDPNAFDPNAGDQITSPAAAPSAAAAPAEAPVPAGEPAASPPERPRNSDGTFKKVIPDYLRGQAQDLGWEDTYIDGFEPEHLGVAIRLAHQSLARERQQMVRQRVASDASQGNVTPEPEPADDLLDLGTDEHGNALTEADVSPAVLRLAKRHAEELRSLKSTVKQFADREQQRQVRNTTTMVDEAFESLGESDHPLFGKGSVNELAPDAAERKRRLAVYREAGIDPENDTPRTIARKIKAARDTLFPTKPAEPKAVENAYEAEPAPARKPKPTVGEWNDSALAKPTQRQANDLPQGRERAMRTVARHLQSQTVTKPEADFEGLPD